MDPCGRRLGSRGGAHRGCPYPHAGGGPARRLADGEAAIAGEPTDPASSAGIAATGLAAWLHKPAGTSATGGPIASRLGQMSWALFEGARISIQCGGEGPASRAVRMLRGVLAAGPRRDRA